MYRLARVVLEFRAAATASEAALVTALAGLSAKSAMVIARMRSRVCIFAAV